MSHSSLTTIGASSVTVPAATVSAAASPGRRPAAVALRAASSILHAVDHGDPAIPRRAKRRPGAGHEWGFTVAELAAKMHALTGRCDYTTRRAAYGLGKLRGKHLLVLPADHGATSSRHWPRAPSPLLFALSNRDYEQIRIDMRTLFTDLAIETPLAA